MKVFYSQHQSVSDNDSYSPSAGKPAHLVAQWLERYPIEIVEPQPVTPEEFQLAHDPAYVQGVLSRQKRNGFGNTLASVAAALPWTTGSLVSAVRHVLAHGGVACSPTSGFHHARYNGSYGFCTFNGLIVAAQLVRSQLARVGIFDCDYHYGDGTDDIIRHLGLDYISHYTTGKHSDPEDPLGFLPPSPTFSPS